MTEARITKTVYFTPDEWVRVEKALAKMKGEWPEARNSVQFMRAGVMQLVECIEEMD